MVNGRLSSDDAKRDSRRGYHMQKAEKDHCEGRTQGQRTRVSHHIHSQQQAVPCLWSMWDGGMRWAEEVSGGQSH